MVQIVQIAQWWYGCYKNCIGILQFQSAFYSFKVDVALLTVIFPKFVYPVLTTSLTASILLMVAITAERYSAVYYPINYNQVRGHHK